MEELGSQAASSEIPDKLYFRIGEVAKLAGIKPYVLRFWESAFPGLGPRKSRTGHRIYRKKDVELVLEIRRLLYEQRFTIEGALKVLSAKKAAHRAHAATQPAFQQQCELFTSPPAYFQELRRELTEILELLDR
jgi:DNA-binding transcriptional MerR regulator